MSFDLLPGQAGQPDTRWGRPALHERLLGRLIQAYWWTRAKGILALRARDAPLDLRGAGRQSRPETRRGLPTGTCVFVDVERLSASGRMRVGVLSNLALDAHGVLSLYDAWLADA